MSADGVLTVDQKRYLELLDLMKSGVTDPSYGAWISEADAIYWRLSDDEQEAIEDILCGKCTLCHRTITEDGSGTDECHSGVCHGCSKCGDPLSGMTDENTFRIVVDLKDADKPEEAP